MPSYYELHKEHLQALNKKYREVNKEKYKAYNAAYYQNITKHLRRIVGRKMYTTKPKPEPIPAPTPEPKKDYTIKTTIKYKEPVPKIPKQPKKRAAAAPKPVVERSGILSFD